MPEAARPLQERHTNGALQRRSFDLEAKATSDSARVTGYASVFNVVDSYGDMIAPGAFTRTLAAWKAKGRPVPVLWQHDTWNPIGGDSDLIEDDHGLAVSAELVTEVEQAREALALARANILGGLSIGFSIPRLASDGQPSTYYDDDTDVYVIREVKLWEYSLVTFPANEEATIDSVTAELAAAAREIRNAAETLTATSVAARARRILEAGAPPAAAHPVDLGALTALLAEARTLLDAR